MSFLSLTEVTFLSSCLDGAGSSSGLRGNGGAGREYGEEEEDDQGEILYISSCTD